MKSGFALRFAVICAVAAQFAGGARGQSGGSDPVSRLNDERLDRAVIWKLEASPASAEAMAALRQAFHARKEKRERQWVAVALLRMGERSAEYYEFLAGYARAAIEDRSPLFQKYDAAGRPVKGEFSVEFLSWCAANHSDPRQVAALQLYEYPQDVLLLAEAEDVRSDGLFRSGLISPNPGVVAYCVQGLGRLGDVAALPLIAVAASRMPGRDPLLITAELPWFGTTDAFRLMERLTPDQRTREYDMRKVEQRRSIEEARRRSRGGPR